MTAESSAFVFADLAGYTALTEAHGDEEAADLVVAFVSRARQLLEQCDGEEVKLMGDELMARIDDPAAAIAFALDLNRDSMQRHEELAVHIGLAYGPAVRRADDWFGSTINLAARIAARSQPGEVLTNAETAKAAGELEGVTYESRGEVELKNLPRPVELVAVQRGHERHDLVSDPVCQMLLDRARPTEHVERNGADYWFCSPECRALFEADPASYA